MGVISTYNYHDKYIEARNQAGEFMAAWKRGVDDYDALMSMLKEANELLRSTSAIAERNGEKTNWPAFRGQVKEALKKQHKILTAYYADAEQACTGHVASDSDPKICGKCGVHIDSLR